MAASPEPGTSRRAAAALHHANFRELVARLSSEFESVLQLNEELRSRNLALSGELGKPSGGPSVAFALAPQDAEPKWPAATSVLPNYVGADAVDAKPVVSQSGLFSQPAPGALRAAFGQAQKKAQSGEGSDLARPRSEEGGATPRLAKLVRAPTQALKAVTKRSATAAVLQRLKSSGDQALSTFEGGGAVGQFAVDRDEQPTAANPQQQPGVSLLLSIVQSTPFEFCFAVLIVINTAFMTMETQYRGMDIGYELDFPGSEQPAEQVWPAATRLFSLMETIFGIVFLIEVVLKMIALRISFFRSGWNLFDTIVVAFWIIGQAVSASFSLNPMTLRLLRLARLVRLARMIKTIQALDSLQVLIGSILASFSVLIWSCVILLTVQLLVALLLQSMLAPYMTDPSVDKTTRQEVYRSFGTFTRSMITMFELTLANWIVPCRLLSDNVSEWYGLGILIYKLVMGFSVVNVITGVFLHETFRVASTDDELMIVQRKRAIKKHGREMDKLFRLADASNDGYISREEFKKVLTIPKVKTWLSAMDLEVEDYDLLFDFLDDGDDRISAQELMRGVSRLRGSARSIDLVAVMRKMLNLQHNLADIAAVTTSLAADLTAQAGDEPPA